MLPSPRYLPAGESALVVEFGTAIDPKVHDRVLALDEAVQKAEWQGVIETVPTYRSLMIHIDPHKLTTEVLADALGTLDYTPSPRRMVRRRWHIPACYDAPYADDIAGLAALLGLPQERVIELHHGARYRVYMYGFAPGWTFLGGLPQELAIPRRAVLRAPVLPGSLLIAGGQALIASCAMPTGWYGIGRTPVKMFDPRREPVFLVNAGDEICFERIDAEAFEALRTEAEAGALVARSEAFYEA
ncbi:MAG: allophanate hydrolase subunit 1 [Beijerinckiaceae bacterium]|nr:allophanate hydrolase subunit 1 [Beijerinckiaceae bacterium]MCI0735059.1 allophanate hydrolase subunit 1 [Beijerinckiaceae bacterium]